MFCNQCGKAIPENSIFCMFCGSKINGPGSVEPAGGSVFEICDLECVFDGPTKKGWLPNSIVFQGFSLVFGLKDQQGRLSSAEGDVELRVKNFLEGKEKTFKFHVNKQDFNTVWIQQSAESRREFFGYIFRFHEPEFQVWNPALNMDSRLKVELWFTTPDKRRLFAKNFS